MIRNKISVAVLAGVACAAGVTFAAPRSMTPGLWENSSHITSIEGPGVPPAMAAAMGRRPPTVSRRCVTAAEAQDGMRRIMENDFKCPSDVRFAAGGAVDAHAVCHQHGGEFAMQFQGHYSPTAFSMTGEGVMSGPRAMTVHSEVSGRRIGSC